MSRIPFVAALVAALVACDDGEVMCTDLAAASVMLTVVDDAGDVIPGATATFSVDGGAAQECTDNQNGSFVCGYEVAGSIVVTASAAGYVDAVGTVVVESDECHVIGEMLTLTLDQTACTDQEVPSIEVTVVGSGGEALEDVRVTWAPSGGDDSAPCDEGGSSWTCGYEQAGDYVVVASAAGHETEVVDVTVEADECHVITEHVDFSLDWLPD